MEALRQFNPGFLRFRPFVAQLPADPLDWRVWTEHVQRIPIELRYGRNPEEPLIADGGYLRGTLEGADEIPPYLSQAPHTTASNRQTMICRVTGAPRNGPVEISSSNRTRFRKMEMI